MKRFAPYCVAVIFLVYLGASALPIRASGGFDLAGFRGLPVSVVGRVQPIDSVARLALLQIRGSVTDPVDARDGAQKAAPILDASEWLLEVLAKPDVADTRRIFPVSDRELIAKLPLSPDARLVAFDDLRSSAPVIVRERQRIMAIKEEDRAPWERALLQLQSKLEMYERLKDSVQPNTLLQAQAQANGKPIAFEFTRELAKFQVDMIEAIGVSERHRTDPSAKLDAATEMRIREFARVFQVVSRNGMLAVIPPARIPGLHKGWNNLGGVIVESTRKGARLPRSVHFMAAITTAFAHGDADVFNQEVIRYRRWLADNGFASYVNEARDEAFYNRFQPFLRSLLIYAVASLLFAVAWRTRSTTLQRAAVMLVLLGFLLHTTGLAFTVILGARPTSFTMVGWALTLTALAAEMVWRRRIGAAAAGAIGLGALVATRLAAVGGLALARGVLDRGFLIATLAMIVVLVMTREVVERQATFNSRHALEVANPRDFNLD